VPFEKTWIPDLMRDLTPDRLHEVDPYLDRALALSPADRAQLIDSIRVDNPETAALLEELLDEYRVLEEEHFLEASVLTPGVGDSLHGQTVGAYKLVSQIAQGGMGTVWLGERSDGRFDRQVAIKFLNLAIGQAGLERFKREGRILGSLTHPHIAQMIDAGVMPAGHAYLVLEYCKGDHIDQYCDSHRLEIDERVAIFLDVIGAVAHAHANLIVHRDIKPSNVIVKETGEVKLLDFGIAKLLAEDGTPDATMLTLESGTALTPQFAAPEQLNGGTITTATDVYALGVLLYLLLTGKHPAGAGLHSPADWVKAVTETEAPRASEVASLSRGDVDTRAIAAKRDTTPERLCRQLRGDLDTILAKAMKKCARERYTSVTAFAEDLRHYLQHEPIKARPDTVGYVAGKFLRRHWLPVSAAALVIGSLAAGLYVSNRERVIAERRFMELRKLSTQVFDLDRNIKNLPGATQARQKLVNASLEYLEGLAPDVRGDPDLAREVAEGYWRIARIQGVPVELNLGEPGQAEISLQKANTLIEGILANHPNDQGALLKSAEITHDRMILAWQDSRNADAVNFARKCAGRMEALLRQPDVGDNERDEVAGMYVNISLVYKNMHMLADAVASAQRSVDIARSIPSSQRNLSQGLRVLADAEQLQGNLQAAFATIQAARKIADRLHYSSETLRMISMSAVLSSEGGILGGDDGLNLGRPEEAITDLQSAVDIAEAQARKDPKDAASRVRLGGDAIDLGDILRDRDPKRALAAYDLAIRRLGEMPDDMRSRQDAARALAGSSYPLRRLHRDSESKVRIDKALAILKATKAYPTDRIEPDDTPVYSTLCALGDEYAYEGDLPHALGTYQNLLKKLMAATPDMLNDLAYAVTVSHLYEVLAQLYKRTGDATGASTMTSRRLDLWNQWNRKVPNNAFVLHQLALARR
jgi:tetratricopeptide (TPR) repeat protein